MSGSTFSVQNFTFADNQVPNLTLGLGMVSVLDWGALGNGTTDDSTAINNAVANVPLGGTLYFPPGYTFLVSLATVNLRNDISVFCPGTSIITGTASPLMTLTNLNTSRLYRFSMSGLVFVPTSGNGCITVSALAFNQTTSLSGSFTNCAFLADSATGTQNLVDVVYTNGLAFVNCFFGASTLAAPITGILLGGASQTTFSACTFANLGLAIAMGQSDPGADGCQGITYDGVDILSCNTGIQSFETQNWQFVNGQIANTSACVAANGDAFVILGDSFFAGFSNAWITFDTAGVSSGAYCAGYQIVGNTFYPAGGVPTDFIKLNPTNSAPMLTILISGNMVNTPGTAFKHGISFGTGVSGLVICDNIFNYQPSVGPLPVSGTVGGPTFSAFRNNLGLNPVGNLGAYSLTPTFPASSASYKNVTGFDCTVYISGGTISSVALLGALNTSTYVTVTNSANVYRVPAGATIAVSYTGTPSWVWFAD